MVFLSVQQFLMAALLLVYTSLPRTATRSLLSSLPSLSSLDHLTDSNTFAQPPSISKRQGADVWSLCPESMEMGDCFDRYLSIYARLRNEASRRDSITIRNIGKRMSRPSNKMESLSPFRHICPDNYNDLQCANAIANLVLDSFDFRVKGHEI